MSSRNLSRFALVALLSVSEQFAWPAIATAQEEQRSSATSREQSDGDGRGDGPGKRGAPVAQVGAGTTDGSTTGYSGPESNTAAEPEEISLPPLPSADVCEPYQDTPAYQPCLWVALRESHDETAGDVADE
jgi:hypothetical protein